MTFNEFSNYLETGALICQNGQWFLYQGAVEPVVSTNALKLPDFSVFASSFFEPLAGFSLSSTHVKKMTSEGLISLCESYLGDYHFEGPHWNPASLPSFEKSFQDIKTRISQKQIEKAVPIVFETTNWRPSVLDRAYMMSHLVKNTPSNMWAYGLWTSDWGLLGASPEVLFHLKGEHIKTMALAGTRAKVSKDQDLQISLLKDPKELKEHNFVVRDLVELLSAWGRPEVLGPKEMELPSLFHLLTEIQMFSSKLPSPMELIQKLHPTPALGVAPRRYGYLWLKDLPEQKNRNFFGAPMTFRIQEDSLVSLVGIRCLEWTEFGSRIGSGCGVVAESILEREWAELASKRHSVKKILGINLIDFL